MLFAEDFDEPSPPEVAVIPSPAEGAFLAEPMFTVADLDAARQDGWAAGREAGLAAAAAAERAAVATAIASIAAQMDVATHEAVAHAEQAAEEIARVVLTALKSALPALCVRHGEAEVRAIMRHVLPPMMPEPAITVRVNPGLVRATEDEIGRLDPDLAERIRLVPTDAMELSDVRISWQDGGATRDSKKLWREIADVLSINGLLLAADVKEDALAG